MMGFMFRKIESYRQLIQYHSAMNADYIIQEYIDYPLEVSVFYYRIPGENKGHISGFIRKEYMKVVGDGVSTLKDLILTYDRAQFRLDELFSKHQKRLDEIIPDGQAYVLSDALNLSRGGKLINLNHEIDDEMLRLFDGLSHYAGFYYGRYDIKCSSISNLKKGKDFSILEFNGCGGEAHHVYSGYSFFEACRILIDHWNIMYKISRKNHEMGVAPWSYSRGSTYMKAVRKHFDALRNLDLKFSLEKTEQPGVVEESYHDFINQKDFPCIAAKAAISKNQVRIFVCDHIACPKDDYAITKFIHDFVEEYQKDRKLYSSAVVIFKEPHSCSEEEFDALMWQRLQSISDIDAMQYPWNQKISRDPESPQFSFCIKEEPLYIVGLHPGSHRESRHFQYPAIVFNPHDQFQKLRDANKYAAMKNAVRKRDEKFSGNVNPMLADFGEESEVYQYSGRVYDKDWECPFKSNHAKN